MTDNKFNPDWDAMAAMVEEQQRMARRVEELTQREWVGLTDEDKKQIAMEANNKSEMSAWEYAQRVGELTEAKLKEKNT
jgi:hypothetical protein